MQSVRTLLAELIDYAGLFPPAGLDMPAVVANYAKYVQSEHSWMLGRLIVPLSRIDEFESATLDLLPTNQDDMPWMISALLPPVDQCDFDKAIDRISHFNCSHADPKRGLALIDTIELKASTSAMIDDALDAIPEEFAAFFEIPTAGDPRGMIAALAGTSGRAKIRTGGVSPELIPPTSDVLAFIRACAEARVPFKATAGLHHPVRDVHPLTYEDTAPTARMHGFLNVFLTAAALSTKRLDESPIEALFEENDPGAFTFEDTGVTHRDIHIECEKLARARESFCLSFGSCSFEEPVNDLFHLGLL